MSSVDEIVIEHARQLRSLGWRVERDDDVVAATQFMPPAVEMPEQGYKLHISSTNANAPRMASVVLPVLGRARVAFKVVSSAEAVRRNLNGEAGLTQIGKLVTIYPRDTAAARSLGMKLDDLTSILPGPVIREEDPVRPGSNVYVRYGSFSPRHVQLRNGRIVPAVSDPQGHLVRDERGYSDQLPGNSIEPFSKPLSSSAAQPANRASVRENLPERLLPVKQLHQGPKGESWLCASTSASAHAEGIVAKIAYANALDFGGRDAQDRLSHEARMLVRLQGISGIPLLRDEFELATGEACILYDYLAGPTLGELLLALEGEGGTPDPAIIRRWFQSIVDLVTACHLRGIAVCDLKPANLVLVDSYHFGLIDLELAASVSDDYHAFVATPGYVKEEMRTAPLSAGAHDLYSLGAVLLSMIVGSDAAGLPAYTRVVANVRAECESASMRRLLDVAELLLTGEIRSVSVLHSSLEEPMHLRRMPRPSLVSRRPEPAWLEEAEAVARHLIQTAIVDDDGARWMSNHPIANGIAATDLYGGSAGIACYLASLYEVTSDDVYLRLALDALTWARTERVAAEGGVPLPGLYFGASGVGFAHLRVYQATDLCAFLGEAAQIALALPPESGNSDLLVGDAGIGMFLLALWRSGGDVASFHEAQRIGKSILSSNTLDAHGPMPTWSSAGLDGDQRDLLYGIAHGTAGIGVFLSELALLDPDPVWKNATSSIVESFARIRMEALGSRRGSLWPIGFGASVGGLHWCHGSAGIGTFLIRAAKTCPAALDLAITAGLAVADGTKWRGTCQCHGLAGDLEFLLDLRDATADERWAAEAQALGRVLLAYADLTERQMYRNEFYGARSASFMVGDAGVGAAFLRLATGRPHEISLRQFGSP
jgi:serine/threonine protein kinase